MDPGTAPRRDSTSDGEQSSLPHQRPDEKTTQNVTEDYPHKFKLLFIVVALAASIFLVSLDMTIVSTAIPAITDDFHSLPDIGWYGSAFFLALAAFQSSWGKAYKYMPLKTVFLTSILIFEIGSLICGVANQSATLIVGRAIAGMGGAGVSSGAYTILAFSVPPKDRPLYTGIIGVTFACASVVGPLLGGAFTSQLTWRWCFYINLPIGGLAAGIIFFTFKTPTAAKPAEATFKEKILQLDLPGSFMIMAAVTCFLLAMQWGGTTKPWNDRDVIGTLVGFGVLFLVFLIIEYFSGDRALLQRHLLKDRGISSRNAYNFFAAGSFFLLLYYLPIYFQSIDGVSASNSGVRNLPLVIGTSLFTIVSGAFIFKTGQYWVMALLGAVFLTIGCGLIYTLDGSSSPAKWIGYQAIAGIGSGLAIQLAIIANQASVAAEDLSSVTALTLFFQTLGGAFFVSAAQTAFFNTLLNQLAEYAPNISPGQVIASGATELRNIFHEGDLPGILHAYMDGLKVAYALSIALAGCGLLSTFLMPIKRLNTENLTAGGAA